jgi:hypothetical protein
MGGRSDSDLAVEELLDDSGDSDELLTDNFLIRGALDSNWCYT